MRFCALALCLTLFSPAGLFAAEGVTAAPAATSRMPQFQTWLMPPDLLKKHLTPDWIPLALEEFERWIRESSTLQRPATACVIAHAEYSATFSEGALRSGTALWKIRRLGQEATSLRFSPLNVSLQNVTWQDRPALSGTSSTHAGFSVLVDRQEGELQSEWECKGTPLGPNWTFDLQLPASQVTVLKISLPPGWKIRAADSQGIITSQKSDSGSLWRILLGNKSNCELAVVVDDSTTSLAPQFSYQQDNQYLIGPEGIRMRAAFKMNLTRGNLSAASLTMDRDLQVVSVTYGSDLPLNWKTKDNENDRILEIRFPESVAGQLKTVQVLMSCPIRLSQDWRLPTLRMREGLAEEILFRLQPQSPLEIKTITPTHCRQIAADAVGEVLFVYRANRLDANLTVNIGNPPLKAVARVSGAIRLEREAWLADYEVDWEAFSGVEYSLPIKIQNGWEIIDVRSSSRRGIHEATTWELQPLGAGTGQQLRMSLQDPLRPGAPQRILLQMRRPISTLDKPFPLPYVEPLLVDDLSMLLMLTSDPQARVILEPGTSFEVLESGQVPAPWAANPFWSQQARSPDSRHLLLKLTAPTPKGELTLRSTETLLASQGLVDTRWNDDQIQEDFTITVHPRNSRVDKVLVYLTESGGSASWKLEPAGGVSLDASRLPVSRHGAWEVKSTGELWELRFSVPQNGPFVIRGSRTRPQTAEGRITQIFLPQSETFEGEVRLSLPRESDLRFDPTGGELTEKSTEQETSDGNRKNRQVIWRYRKLDDQLTYRAEDFRLNKEAFPSCILEFSIRMGPPSPTSDLFQARYLFPSEIQLGTFHWKLPKEAQMLDATVDGRRVEFSTDSTGFGLAGTDRLRGKIVELTFTHSLAALQDRVIILPQVSLPISRCEWKLFLSDGLALQEWPLALGTPDRDPGRVWNQLWPARGVSPQPDPRQPPQKASPSKFERPGDSLWQSVTVSVPEKVRIRLWDRHRFTLLAWQSLLGSLLFWLLIRLKISEQSRTKWLLHFVWLGALTALWLPHGWAFVMWALLAGAVLSSLIPLWWLPPGWNAVQQNSRQAPLASTHLQSSSQASLVLFALLLTQCSPLSAQVNPTALPSSPTSPSKPPPTVATEAPSLKVLIPADESGKPVGEKPVIYLSPEWQKWIEQRTVSEVEKPYFVRSARYTLNVPANLGTGEQGTLTVNYEFDIPKQSTSAVKVLLPLSGVRFSGSNACRVNGRPTEIYALPQGKGVYFWIDDTASKKPALPEQSTTAKPEKEASQNSNAVPVSAHSDFIRYTVEFNCIPRMSAQGEFQLTELQTPEIANAQLSVQFPRAMPRFEVIGARGNTTKIDSGLRYEIQLGNGSNFQVRWSDIPVPVKLPLQAELTAYGLADVSPLLTTIRYRLEVQPTQGELERLTLVLPAQSQLRELKGAAVSDYRELGAVNGDNQILVEFARPQKTTISIELLFVLQTGDTGNEFSIPPIRLLDAQKNPEIRLFAHQLALRASPEYSFEASSDVGEHSIPITIESFLESWGKETIAPQAAFRILDAVPLKFFLRPQATSRQIENIKYQAVITPQRVNVIWEADVEISPQSPAFQHHLDVDPQIQIQQIFVTGDDANRLLYWTRTGNRVSLYLRERTIGRQHLRIEGRFPLKIPGDMDWPEIRLLNVTPSREEWALSMSPEITADVELSDGFRRLPGKPEDDTLAEGRLSLGTYETISEKHRLRVRVMRNVPKLSCLTLTTIEQRESNWKFGVQFLFRVQEGVGTQFELGIPDTLPQFQVEAKEARVLQKKQPDGSTLITFLLKSPTRDLFQASVTADMPIPRESLWKVPMVTPLQVLSHTPYLLVNPPDLIERDTERSTGLRETKQLPELQRLAPAVLISQSRIFEGNTLQWILPLKGHSTSTSQAPISWVEDLIWVDSSGPLRGRTQLLLSGSPMPPLEFSLGQEIRLDRIEVNGLSQTPHQRENRYTLDFERSRSSAVVSIDWSENSRRNWYRRTDVDIPLPQLRSHVPRFRHPMVMRSASAILPETTGNLNSRWWNWSLERLETMAEFLGRHGREDRAFGMTLRQELDDLKNLVENSRIKPPTGALQTRYATLLRKTHELEVDELGRTSLSENQEGGEILAGLRQLTPNAIVVYESPGNVDRLHFFQIGQAWLLIPVTLLVLVLGRRMLAWITRWHMGKLLDHSPAIGWLLCAICWYFWLAPAWVALFLLFLAGLHAANARKATPAPEQSVEFHLQEV